MRVCVFQRNRSYSEANGGTHVYRFPIEVALVTDAMAAGVGAALAEPLAAGEAADRQAPVVVRDPRRLSLWQEMAQVTGRTLDADLESQLQALADEFELTKKEQRDNIKDGDIFDPNNDDLAKRRGSPDPNWGNIVP